MAEPVVVEKKSSFVASGTFRVIAAILVLVGGIGTGGFGRSWGSRRV